MSSSAKPPGGAAEVSVELLTPELPPARYARLLDGIQALQAANMVENINTEMALSEGYLTLAHSRPLLEALARRAPQVVLTSDDAVVGFSLTATPSLRDADPSDAPAAALLNIYTKYFGVIDTLRRPTGAPLGAWAMGGQVCVARGWRRRGLLRRAYDAQRAALKDRGYDALATAVDRANVPSLRAHLAAGFSIVADSQEIPSVAPPGALPEGATAGWAFVVQGTDD